MGLICLKRVFPVKNRKSKLHYRIQHIRISLSTKFHLKLLILIFSTKFAQKRISGQKPKKWTSQKQKKSEHHHWILHIPIGLAIKFQLKLIILILWTKFAQKGYFRSKTKKANITIEFCIFQLDLLANLTLNWQFRHFRPNLPKKSISNQKQKKWTSSLNSAYSN